MKKPWFLENSSLLSAIQSDLARYYPMLQVKVESREVVLRGSFPVLYQGLALDWFQIEITLPYGFPRQIPNVRETGGRIPWTADRHVFTNGNCCLFLPDARFQVWPAGASFLDFLRIPVHNYFLGQALVERGDPWPGAEWGHNVDGVLEFYREILGIDDELTIARFLSALTNKEYKGHWLCPCGSGQILRRCHRELVHDLRGKIPPEIARESFQRVAAKIIADHRKRESVVDPS